MKNKLQKLKPRNFIIDQIMIIMLAFNYAYTRTWFALVIAIIFVGMVIYRQRGFKE
jgi:hypothetical protein